MNNINKQIQIMNQFLIHICTYFPLKMSEIREQDNRCYKCKSGNIKLPTNDPSACITSFGNSPDLFSSNGSIHWVAVCEDCGNTMPIYSTCEYDSKTRFKVTSGDFFMDECENHGHYKEFP